QCAGPAIRRGRTPASSARARLRVVIAKVRFAFKQRTIGLFILGRGRRGACRPSFRLAGRAFRAFTRFGNGKRGLTTRATGIKPDRVFRGEHRVPALWAAEFEGHASPKWEISNRTASHVSSSLGLVTWFLEFPRRLRSLPQFFGCRFFGHLERVDEAA